MASITFVDTVTHIPAEWANDADALIYDIFGGASTKPQAVANLGLGTISEQDAAQVQIVGGTLDAVTIGYTQAGIAKFQNILLLQEPLNNQHATTKLYVDSKFAAAMSALGNLQVNAPLTGNGSMGNPLTILSPNLSSPTVGTRVLLKRADGTYEAVPIPSILPTSIANAVGTFTQGFNEPNTVPVWADPGVPAGQDLAYTKLLINMGIGLQLQVGTNLPSGAVFDAHDLQFDRTLSTQTVTGSQSAILSGASNTVESPNSVILGGQQNSIINNVVGNDGCVIGNGGNNSVSGIKCAILVGDNNIIVSTLGDQSTNSVICAGSMNVISGGIESAILVGSNIYLGGDGSAVLAGEHIDVEHDHVTIVHGNYIASRLSNSTILCSSMIAAASPIGVLRRSMAMTFMMNAETSPSDTTFLTSGWPSQDADHVYTPPNNVVGAFEVKMMALSKNAATQFVWRAEGRIWRYGGTLFINYTSDPNPSGYVINLTTSAGALEGLIVNVNQIAGSQSTAFSAKVDVLETEGYLI